MYLELELKLNNLKDLKIKFKAMSAKFRLWEKTTVIEPYRTTVIERGTFFTYETGQNRV